LFKRRPCTNVEKWFQSGCESSRLFGVIISNADAKSLRGPADGLTCFLTVTTRQTELFQPQWHKRLDWLGWQSPRPRPLAPPPVVRPPRYPQRRQGLLRWPAASLPCLLDLFIHPLLQLRRQLAIIL